MIMHPATDPKHEQASLTFSRRLLLLLLLGGFDDRSELLLQLSAARKRAHARVEVRAPFVPHCDTVLYGRLNEQNGM